MRNCRCTPKPWHHGMLLFTLSGGHYWKCEVCGDLSHGFVFTENRDHFAKKHKTETCKFIFS